MSAQILAERTLTEMGKHLQQNAAEVMNLRYSAATGAMVNSPGGGVAGGILMPASSAEDIGLQAIEINAYRRGMQEAADILREQLQQLIAPEPEVPPAERVNGAEKRPDPIY